MKENAARQQQENEKLIAQLRTEFKITATEILSVKTAEFRRATREAMDAILNPFNQTSRSSANVWKNILRENHQRGALQQSLKASTTEPTVGLPRRLPT